jgi:hypothetical protein
MARRLQLGALILGMLLVAAERFTANASQLTQGTDDAVFDSMGPIPPPQ